MTASLLIVDDEPAFLETLQFYAGRQGREADACDTISDALARCKRGSYTLVIVDLRMPDGGALRFCRELRALGGRPDIVVMTAQPDVELAVEVMRAGACDFVVKPVTEARLQAILERNGPTARRRDSLHRAETLLDDSQTLMSLRPLLRKAAASAATVLITGESGTGKEVVARALHSGSARASGPWVPINCSALPEALLESELFGHVKGAFTGAAQSNPGLLRAAHGGTLFLDEIGDMPKALQSKLLRVLQERRVRPVGGTEETSFDVRVISATHCDLLALIATGNFRSDLYYRLRVLSVHLPPLRERQSEILTLARNSLTQHAHSSGKSVLRFTKEVELALDKYAWPGNVRELHNCMEHAVAMADGEEIVLADLPAEVRDAAPLPLQESSLASLERAHILATLAKYKGNRSRAAPDLGLSRRALQRKLARLLPAPKPPKP